MEDKNKFDPNLIDRADSGVILDAIGEAVISIATELADAARADFVRSGLTPDEFNSRNFRDDGKMFASLKDGKMQVVAFIKMPEGWAGRKKIAPESVLKLYHENLSLKEIAASLKRNEKWVRQNLSKFGIRFGPKGVRVDATDIPFGWLEKQGELTINNSEQWVLEKIEDDLRKGVSPSVVCKSLNALNIKTRTSTKWIEEMLQRALTRNKRLKLALAH